MLPPLLDITDIRVTPRNIGKPSCLLPLLKTLRQADAFRLPSCVRHYF
jgi:hypothetical protein